MRISIFLLVASLLAGCTTRTQTRVESSKPQVLASDPIDELVARLPSDGMWQNGLFMPIDLPSSAKAEDVVAQVYQKENLYQGGGATSYQIIEIRRVSGGLTAVLVDTNLGEKIVLLQYDAQLRPPGWWNRVYDAKPSA